MDQDDSSAPAAHEPRDEQGRFLPGNTGAGGGRPKGSRNKLSEAFWNDLAQAWDEHGQAAMRTLATEEPAKFVQVAASLMPKQLEVNVVETLTDEQLDASITQLASQLGLTVSTSDGTRH
jgi:hypothetical protein